MFRLTLLNVEIRDHIGVLTLNRPPVNALNREMISQLNEALDHIEDRIRQKELRVLVIRSSGPHFCAGADLKERQQIPAEEVESVVDSIRDTFLRIDRLPVPVSAVIDGAALGGGLELALAADWRIVTPEARLGLPETGLAIIPGAGGTQRLARLIGYSKALYWIASAKTFSGIEAFEAGVAEFITKKEDLERFWDDLARSITRNGPIAVQAAKKAIREGLQAPLGEALQVEKQYYKETIFTDDRLEGIRAFLEKRNPEYKGK